MDFVGDTSTAPKQFKKICIREHVPEVQKRDQEIYFPFSLTRSSEEHNHQANIIAPLLLENNVAAHVVTGNTTVDAINDKRQDAVSNHRNLEGKKLQKFRKLSNVYKGIVGSFLEVDPEDESSDETLSTSIENKKDVRQNCKNRGAVKEKRRTSQAVKRNLVGAKWTKHETLSSCSKDSELGSTSLNGLRKNKIGRFDMQVMNKLKRSTPEIVYENSGAACLDGQENTSEIKKDSLLLARKERKRKTTQEDIAMMILKLRDGSWRHLTVEENRSDLSDAEIMVASWLIEFSAGVKAKKSNTETRQPTASACSLPQGKQDESEICVMNRNPSEFSAAKAKKFMRCGLKIAKGEK